MIVKFAPDLKGGFWLPERHLGAFLASKYQGRGTQFAITPIH